MDYYNSGYYDYVYYDSGVSSASGLLGGIAAVGGIVMLISAALSILMLVSMWKVFKKCGKPGWAVFVPIYNTYVMCEIAGKPWWYLLLFFVPFANIYAMFVLYDGMAKKLGKSTGFTIGMMLLPMIFFPILAFSKSAVAEEYVEPVTESAPVVEPMAAPVFEQPAAPALEPVQAPVFEQPVAPAVEPVQAPMFEQPVAPAVEPVQAPMFEQPVQSVPQQPVTPAIDEMVEEPAIEQRPTSLWSNNNNNNTQM